MNLLLSEETNNSKAID